MYDFINAQQHETLNFIPETHLQTCLPLASACQTALAGRSGRSSNHQIIKSNIHNYMRKENPLPHLQTFAKVFPPCFSS